MQWKCYPKHHQLIRKIRCYIFIWNRQTKKKIALDLLYQFPLLPPAPFSLGSWDKQLAEAIHAFHALATFFLVSLQGLWKMMFQVNFAPAWPPWPFIATATTIIVVINPSSIPHQSYVHPPLLQKRVPPKPKDPFQSRCLEHLFANYLCWSKAESVPLSNAVMSFCPTMLAHTIHGLKKPIENCLAEVSFNQLHPCDTPEKWISSDTLHLFSMFEWWMFWAGSETPNLLQNFRIVSTSSWSPILLRKSVSLFHPKKRLLKKTKRWSCLKGASITVQMDQKSSKTQELLETRGNQHLLKALSWYTSANVMHVEYSYSCINLSKKTPDAGYLGISSVSNGRQSFVSQSTLSNNPQSSRQISSQNCHTWHSLIQKKGLFTSNPCKKTQHG